MKNQILLILFILMIMSVNCSSGRGYVDDSSVVPADPVDESSNQSYSVLLNGQLDLDTGEITSLERDATSYMNVTSIIGSNFSFTLDGVLPENVLDITLNLINASTLTVYDVLIVLENLYGKEIVNPDGYIDIFQPQDIDPFIAFRKEDPFRAFPPGSDSEELFLRIPAGASALVDFFIIAHLGENTGGVYKILDFQKLDYLTTDSASTAQIQVRVFDYQNDVSSVRVDTSDITGGITDLSPTADPEVWTAEIMNTQSAPVGTYPVIIEATSPSTPNYKTYEYSEITVDFDFSAIDSLMSAASFDSVVLLQLEGDVLYEKAFGGFNIDERVQLVSANKWVTSTLIMKMVDQGVINLDNTVVAYLDGWGGWIDPRKNDITIRHCLSHLSGLGTQNGCLSNPDGSMRDCAYDIGSAGFLLSTPGNSFIYGQNSIQVAAYICEQETGIPFAQLVEQELTSPLGMTSYGFTETPGEYVNNPQVGAGGYCTAGDYAKMLQMLVDGGILNGERFISESSVNELFTNQTDGATIIFTPYLLTEYAGNEYNLGNWREEVDPGTDELWVAGCQGILGFSPWIDFRKDLVGVLLAEDFFTSVFPVYLDLKDTVNMIVPDKED